MKTHETLTLDLPVFITFPIRLHIHCDLIFLSQFNFTLLCASSYIYELTKNLSQNGLTYELTVIKKAQQETKYLFFNRSLQTGKKRGR